MIGRKRSTIQNRLFQTYSLLIGGMLVVFLALFFLYTTHLMRTQAYEAMRTQAVNAMDAVDEELRKMDTVSMNISYASLIQDQYAAYRALSEGVAGESGRLSGVTPAASSTAAPPPATASDTPEEAAPPPATASDTPEGAAPPPATTSETSEEAVSLAQPASDTVERYNREKVLIDLFIAISGPNRTVKQINLYEPSGVMIGAGLYSRSVRVDPATRGWYEAVQAKQGARVLVRPHRDPLLETDPNTKRQKWYLSLCRIYYAAGHRYAGIVEIKQDYDTVFRAVAAMGGKTAEAPRIRLYDASGAQVFPLPQDTMGIAAPSAASGEAAGTTARSAAPSSGDEEAYLSALPLPDTGETGSTRLRTTRGMEIVTGIRSGWSGYTTVIAQSEGTLFSPLYAFMRLFLSVSLVLLLLTVYLSYALAQKLTTPIRKVHEAIRGLELSNLEMDPPQPPSDNPMAEDGDAAARQPVSSLDELEALNTAFHGMNRRLRESLNELLAARTQQMQAKLMALQAQMDPHFYHNSLSTISILAEENRNDRVIEMCRHLSRMMRYVAGESQARVPLSEEIDHVERYLACMKIRYETELFHQIDIPEAMRAIPVPKLLIQPLVENALKYGIHVPPPWHVSVTGTCGDGQWRITVRDNGPGFSPEALDRVRTALAAHSPPQAVPELGIDGMGLVNIGLRLKLIDREDTLFLLENAPEGGACVTIGGRWEGCGAAETMVGRVVENR